MDRYRLTERGKLSLSIILVLVLLVIPSIIILTVATCTGASQSDASPSPASTQQTGEPDEDDPAISVTPQPTPNSTEPTPDETSEPTPTPDPPTPTPTPTGGNGGFGNGNGSTIPEYGPVGLNIAEGTMEFIFSPDNQESLDVETVAMLGEFLSSPKNSSRTLVRVEAPDLSDDFEAALVSAVVRAFSLYDISEDGLLFVNSGAEATEQYFEVALSFTAITNQK